MQNLLKFALFAAITAALAACGSSEPEPAPESELDLSSVDAKVSYSLAFNQAQQFTDQGVEPVSYTHLTLPTTPYV